LVPLHYQGSLDCLPDRLTPFLPFGDLTANDSINCLALPLITLFINSRVTWINLFETRMQERPDQRDKSYIDRVCV
jgi:hypothetical protein